MPPIAPAPQGSRAALITALVIFVILFVTATIFSIYCGTKWQAEARAHVGDIAALAPAANSGDLANPDVQEVNQDAAKRSLTGITNAIAQRNKAKALIAGNAAAPLDSILADTSRTIADVKSQLATAKVNATVGDDNLLASLKSVTAQVVLLSNQVAQKDAEIKAANDKTAQAIKEREAALADKDKAIAAAQQDAADAKKVSTERQTQTDTNVAAIQKTADDSVRTAQQATAGAQAELTKVTAQFKKLSDDYARLVRLLAKFHIDPTNALLRPSGQISRTPGDNTCFINLGQGDEVTVGMTFEVYDKRKGLPTLTQGNGRSGPNLPEGKASIEIIRVLPGTSECRIINLTPGYQIIEGDPILNLVYNTHTHFNFVVYGDFDLANTGLTTPGDVDVVRRLVTQWGGHLNDQIGVDTDFLVLGKEPVVAPLPDNPTATDQKHHDDQVKAQADYLNVEDQAQKLFIPILNQNRFLYFTGYYDQAKR